MIRHKLTNDQKRAAATSAPLAYVESSPGSGKTTVAAERFGVLRYEHHRNDPRGVFAVSFARSAAAELGRRIAARWGTRTMQQPNLVTTMDGLHRSVVDFLLRTGLVRWTRNPEQLTVIDSWARHRGASRIYPTGRPDQRWELGLNGDRLALAFRQPESTCFGMPFNARAFYVEALQQGICTHDEIRQLVGVALGRPDLSARVDEFLARSCAHLIVDEAFDLNGLDAVLIERAIRVNIGVTLVGDPWQALYEWRGARPEMVHRLVVDHHFRVFPMTESFRFQSAETINLAARLRDRQPVDLVIGDDDAEVVLAAEWEHVLRAGDNLIPQSFGQLDCQTDASLTLLLDEVLRARLNVRALGLPEAMACLRRNESTVDLAATLATLRDASMAVSDVMEVLREATRVATIRLPSLPPARRPSRLERLDRIRQWFLASEPHILGLSFHQAKGRQWSRVDVALDEEALAVLRVGLNEQLEGHRKLYVALTRGSHRTRLRPV